MIAYACRGLRGAEKNMSNYSSMKLELLALKWEASDKFKEGAFSGIGVRSLQRQQPADVLADQKQGCSDSKR